MRRSRSREGYLDHIKQRQHQLHKSLAQIDSVMAQVFNSAKKKKKKEKKKKKKKKEKMNKKEEKEEEKGRKEE